MPETLNDGRIHSFDEIKNYGMEHALDEFSEGHPLLRKCLVNLWTLGIETTACCKGTNEKDHKSEALFRIPYIAINVTQENKDKIFTLINYLMGEKSISKPHILLKNYNKILLSSHDRVLVLEQFFLSNGKVNEFFQTIANATEKMKMHQEIKSSPLLKMILDSLAVLSEREIPVWSQIYAMQIVIKNNSATFEYSVFKNAGKFKKEKVRTLNAEFISEFIKNETIQNAKTSFKDSLEK